MAKENITLREKDYSQWYVDIITNAKLADYAPVKGCMVIRPNGYSIWENIQKNLDKMFKDTGHVNAYFPLLIPDEFLKKEAEHVEGFSPELAVVTHAGGKKLDSNLVIRPTSETIIWHMYKQWIKSWRDLPILINQWANVVRWEMRTRLFLRTTEFLWQEGHTAHETAEEAEQETLKMLEVYKKFAEEYLAIPVYHGLKTDAERFAGAIRTYCIEAMMQDKKALQAGTSHNLGQNFARAFEVTFQNKNGVEDLVWATSWGVSTRLIGAIIMAHSDDDGLVLPPKIATNKAVFIPIYKAETKSLVLDETYKLSNALKDAGINVIVDDRDNYSPGFKHNDWEVQGIPLRIEIGPKDIEKKQVVIARRDTNKKEPHSVNGLAGTLNSLLDAMQKSLFDRALEFRNKNTIKIDDYEEMKKINEKENMFFLAHWDGTPETEEKLRIDTKMTIRCIPFNDDNEEGKCIISGKPSKKRVLIAKAY